MASLFGASVAAAYALHRPILPPAVVAAILAEAGSGVKRIVDIACGSGQLTLALAAATPRATVVVGLDASPAQLSFARDADPGGRVLWRQGTATETGEETGAADLLTVAQALHWCVPARPPASPAPPPRPFYVEAARVLRPGGTFAAVSYGLASICAADADGGTPLPAATAVLHAAHDDTLAAYWAPERALVLNGMRGLDPTPGELPITASRPGSASAQHDGKHGAAPVDPDALFEQMLDGANLNLAWKQVKANKGAPGVDGMTIDDFPAFAREHWERIRSQLSKGTYHPAPVRRVFIPKPDGSQRPLGVPTVLDRVIQQAIAQVLTPLYDDEFSANSYGFRAGRNAHQAVRHVESGWKLKRRHAVDCDLKAFFDTVNHDRLLTQLRDKIGGGKLLQLIGR